MTLETRADSEKELMNQVSNGSVDAFEKLYDLYSDRAYRVALSVCREETQAQDAVQDAFLSIWKSRTSYREQRGTVAAWLLTAVRYRAIDLQRRDQKHATGRTHDDPVQEPPATDNVADEAVQRTEAERLRASLARLPDAQQEVITLAYYGQLTHTEIATQLGLPAGTVKGRMRLGLEKLRASIDRPAHSEERQQHVEPLPTRPGSLWPSLSRRRVG